jgi:hypothetical protein
MQATLNINPIYEDVIFGNESRYLVLKGSAGCFAQGTLVQTSDGLKEIQTIQKGEQVLSFNHESEQWEYRKVLETFQHKRLELRQKMLIFILSNGRKIHCTYNHEFYNGRDYVSAIQLAKRAMAASSRYKPKVFHFHNGKTFNNRLEGHKPNKDNETCIGCKRLSENYDKEGLREIKYNQNAQASCTGILAQSRKLSNCKPQRWSKDQQCGGKLGMDEPFAECTTQLCNRYSIQRRFKKSNFKTNRRPSQGNKGYLCKQGLQKERICSEVQYSGGNSQRCAEGQLLDSREIKAIVFGKQEQFVYDLCVENNHNYTIGQDRFLVHNSGKSRAVAQKIILRMLAETGHRFLVTRKVKDTLKNSVYQELVTVIQDLGVSHLFTCITSPLEIRCRNKNKIIFIGADDPEKMKSLSGITGIWLEEASDFEPNDFDQLDLRLRGQTKNYQQILLSFNPISEQHWLKARFFDRVNTDCTTLSTTYKDNRFLSAEHGARMEQLKLVNENYYRIYALGEWGKIKTGQEFYKNYDVANIDKCDYASDFPLHLSFDFNVVPYVSCLVSQVIQTEGTMVLYVLEEITLSSPNNTTKALCQRFKAKYPDARRVYVYGDPAGNSRDTRSGGTDYTIIMKELEWCNPINRVATSAPKLYLRNLFMNNLLARVTKGKLVISPNCKLLIKDLEEVIEAADGTKLKKKVRDKATNQSYEEVGHLSDCLDYLCCKVFEAEFLAIQGKKAGYSIA